MGLGTNRDYKTNDRRVRTNLMLLKELTDQFEAKGLPREDAEEKAYYFIMHPVKILTALAKDAITNGIREREFIATSTPCPEFSRAARKAYRAAKAEVSCQVVKSSTLT